MKQFNVRDETHKLGRLLGLTTGKSILDVVQEALEMYQASLEGNAVENDILQRAAAVIDERMCRIVHEEVPHAIDEVVRLQEAVFEEQKQEIEQILKEVRPEEPTEADEHDDLEEVSYEEFYGKDGEDKDKPGT